MTTHHNYPDSTVHDGPRAPHRITDRDVYLLLALQVAVMMLWAFWTLVGVDLTVANGTQTREVSLARVTLTTTFAALGAYLLLRLMRGPGLRGWTIAATTGAMLSCVGPLLATTSAAGGALLSFHLVVGAGLIVGVRHLHRHDR